MEERIGLGEASVKAEKGSHRHQPKSLVFVGPFSSSFGLTE